MSQQLSQEQMERIRRKVEDGLYGSPEQALERALALLDEYDRKLAALRTDIGEAIEEADAGRLTPASEVFNNIEQRNARRSAYTVH